VWRPGEGRPGGSPRRASPGRRLGGAVVAEIERVELQSARRAARSTVLVAFVDHDAWRCGSTRHGETFGGLTGRPHRRAQDTSPPGSASWSLRPVRSRPSRLVCVTPSSVERDAWGGGRGARRFASGDQDCGSGEFCARRPIDDMDRFQTRAVGAPPSSAGDGYAAWMHRRPVCWRWAPLTVPPRASCAARGSAYASPMPARSHGSATAIARSAPVWGVVARPLVAVALGGRARRGSRGARRAGARDGDSVARRSPGRL
jgi:hypothetical protein